MYGLVHTALQKMVVERFSRSTWDEIVEQSEVPVDSFLTMRPYDDEITLALINSASTILNMSVDESLEAFGHYWLTSFAPHEYGMLLDHAGRTPFGFIKNLDDLHDRISTVFSDFRPPSFRVELIDDKHARVTYRSERTGLTPFVLGIMKGLDDYFEEGVEVLAVTSIDVPFGEQSQFELRTG